MSHDPTNLDDIIDSRDIIKRISELEDERDDLVTERDDAKEAYEDACKNLERANDWEDLKAAAIEAERDLASYDEEGDGQELKALQALADQAEGYSDDWTHGATLIRDSYFREYAQDLADDIGAIPKDAGWPSTCIDWEQATDELKQDYTSVDFDGVDYWVR